MGKIYKEIELRFMKDNSIIEYLDKLYQLSKFLITIKNQGKQYLIPVSLINALNKFPGNIDLMDLVFYSNYRIKVTIILIAKHLVCNYKIPRYIIDFWKNYFNKGNEEGEFYEIESIKTLLNLVNKKRIDESCFLEENYVIQNIDSKKIQSVYDNKLFFASVLNFDNENSLIVNKGKVLFFEIIGMYYTASILNLILSGNLNLSTYTDIDIKKENFENLIPFYFIEYNLEFNGEH